MKMKKLIAGILLVCFCALLTSCGRKNADMEFYEKSDWESSPGEAYTSDAGFQGAYDSYSNGGDMPSYASNDAQGITFRADPNLKLIYTGNVSVETLKYDESLSAIMEAISRNGGFVSRINEGGGYTSSSGYYHRKWIDLECRIPAEKYQEFLDGSDDFGNVTSLLSNMQDITSSYVDIEARLNSLNAQKDRLTNMMEKAQTVSELIEIESQLSEVIYQIESYTAQKNTYDSLLAYSTVSISLQEVSTVTHSTDTFWDRLVSSFIESFHNFVGALEDILFLLIHILPFAILFMIIGIPLIKGIRKRRKAKKENKEKVTENSADQIPKQL